MVCQRWLFERHVEVGIGLAHHLVMKFYCRHCDQVVVGEAYRVLSEEDGLVLLDMTVCRPCYEQAKDLGLYSEAIPSNPSLIRRRDLRAYLHQYDA